MEYLHTLWEITNEAAPYLILGLIFAGIIKAFLKDEFIQKHLGKDNISSVLKASLFGVPLPLCSCGVVPTAVSLRKQGASKSATTSFLISTPESGADSIAISYALLDPFLTVIRPVAGFITATIAGVVETFFPEKKIEKEIHVHSCCSTKEEPVVEEIETDSCCSTDNKLNVIEVDSCCSTEKIEEKPSFIKRLTDGLKYSFFNLMEDISYTLIIGLALAAAITYFVPESFFTTYLSNPYISMLVMLVVGIPMYICATASTPIAAALIMKGLSPGAAIVFLIAGPATNLASITVLQKILGKDSIARYLASIIIMSLVFGALTNLVYSSFDLPIQMMSSTMEHSWLHISGMGLILTCVFLLFLAIGLWNDRLKKIFIRSS